MRIDGRRIHIAGSASPATETRLLRYAQDIIDHLVESLAARGATFATGVGKEPRAGDEHSGIPIIFDWTLLAAAHRCLQNRTAQASGQHGRLIATVASSKTDQQIPDARRVIWQEILTADAVGLEHVEPGWASGAVRRARLVARGDILIILSGGEGVEHLAREYALEGKPVIPLDLDIGSSSGDGNGGAARLSREMLTHPERFVSLVEPDIAGSILTRMATHQGTTAVPDVVDAILKLMEALTPPVAFYVRLLNRGVEQFPMVERFFRHVVDPLVEDAGYKPVEMGLSDVTHPWINQQIFETLHDAGLVVADLTAMRPDCFVELGYALGRARQVILTAHKETRLTFDLRPIDCHFWEDAANDSQRIAELEKYWRRVSMRPPIVKPRGLL